MDDLDLLKKNWQKSDNFKVITEQDIYGMLHKKSSSVVKWIFYVSVLEILFWFLLDFFLETDKDIDKLENQNMNLIFNVLIYITYAVSFCFIYAFYKNYTKISANSTIKQLMSDILKTRKTVQYYVYYNLGMMVFSFVFGMTMIFIYNPEMKIIEEKITQNSSNFILMILGIFAVLLVLVIVFWLFYKLLYGFFLKKLKANYDELLKIDL